MKNNKLVLAMIACVVIAAGIIGWLYFGGDKPVNVDAGKGVTVKTNAAMKNSVLKREENGRVLWEFTVEEVENDNQKKTAILKGIKGKVYRTDGSYIDVSADSGTAQLAGNDFSAIGHVKAVLNTGGTLDADRINWNQKTEKIVGIGHIKITKDGYVATADRAETTSAFTELKLKGHAKVQKGGN